MNEELQQAQEELKDTAEPMPSSEQPTDNDETAQEDLSLPDGVSERTKEQFEKLKKQLAEEKARNAQPQSTYASVMDELYPSLPPQDISHLSQQQVQNYQQEAVSENGEVDIALLNRTLREANERAMRAEQLAREAQERARKFEETQQVRELHKQYPQMDPSSPEFNPQFYEFVKNDLIGQMMKGTQDVKSAAQKAAALFQPTKPESQVKEQAVAEYKKVVSQKEQSTSSGSKHVSQPIDQDELRQKSVKGDMNAIYARLQASGY